MSQSIFNLPHCGVCETDTQQSAPRVLQAVLVQARVTQLKITSIEPPMETLNHYARLARVHPSRP